MTISSTLVVLGSVGSELEETTASGRQPSRAPCSRHRSHSRYVCETSSIDGTSTSVSCECSASATRSAHTVLPAPLGSTTVALEAVPPLAMPSAAGGSVGGAAPSPPLLRVTPNARSTAAHASRCTRALASSSSRVASRAAAVAAKEGGGERSARRTAAVEGAAVARRRREEEAGAERRASSSSEAVTATRWPIGGEISYL